MVLFQSSFVILCSTHDSFYHSRTFTFKQTDVTNSQRSFTKPWMLTCTHKRYVISIHCPSHNCWPEKSCLHWIVIMSRLFKYPVVIMKEIMSWLLKDPIRNDLAQFDHAQSNNRKWPIAKKDQIAPNEFFSQKITNKTFMYLLAPFILQNF